MSIIIDLWEHFLGWLRPTLRVKIVVGDSLPAILPKHDLVLVQDDGENWSVGLHCPCGCGDTLELMLLENVKPRWDLEIDTKGRPSLTPSVWRTTGCKSHFWISHGKVDWCN